MLGSEGNMAFEAGILTCKLDEDRDVFVSIKKAFVFKDVSLGKSSITRRRLSLVIDCSRKVMHLNGFSELPVSCVMTHRR